MYGRLKKRKDILNSMTKIIALKEKVCPICKKPFEAGVGEVFCKTSCRKKASGIEKYTRNYMIGRV